MQTCPGRLHEEPPWRDILKRWRRARDNGLSAADAAHAVGVLRATLYRWQRLANRNRLKPCSRRPHTLRRPARSAALVAAVQETRADYPMWGKIAVLLRRDGHAISESTTGRILKTLMERGAVTPVPSCNGPCAARRLRPDACPGAASPQAPARSSNSTPSRHTRTGPPSSPPMTPLDLRPGLETRHRTQRQALPRQAPMPFPAIQIDGGSGFKADFDASTAASTSSCPDRPSSTDTSSATTAHGEFYASWDLPDDNLDHINRWAFADETFRPYQTAPGPWRTHPARVPHTAENPLRLICPEPRQ